MVCVIWLVLEDVKIFTLEVKYNVIKCHEKDDRPKAVSDALSFPWLTDATILKGKDRSLNSFMAGLP